MHQSDYLLSSKAAGQFVYKGSLSKTCVNLSSIFLSKSSEIEIRKVLLHEMIHDWTADGVEHGVFFELMMAKINSSGHKDCYVTRTFDETTRRKDLYIKDLNEIQIKVWIDPISNYLKYKSFLDSNLKDYPESFIIDLLDFTYELVSNLRRKCISSYRKFKDTWLEEYNGRVESNRLVIEFIKIFRYHLSIKDSHVLKLTESITDSNQKVRVKVPGIDGHINMTKGWLRSLFIDSADKSYQTMYNHYW